MIIWAAAGRLLPARQCSGVGQFDDKIDNFQDQPVAADGPERQTPAWCAV
jgi:hypothetical protein